MSKRPKKAVSKKAAKTTKTVKSTMSAEIKKGIETHKTAAKKHLEAAKHHLEVVKHHENGNHELASKSKALAHRVFSYLSDWWNKK